MPTSRSASNPQLFHCPTCGASLPSPGDVASVRCEYCGSTVLVPAEFRTHKTPENPQFSRPVVINLDTSADYGTPTIRARSPLVGILSIIILCSVGVTILGTVLAASGVFSAAAVVNQVVNQTGELPGQMEVLTQVAQALPTQEPTGVPFYNIALQFGSKGTGPGQFDDARWLAVDPDGSIFTAEFQDGRVQKFDPGGKFTALFNVPPDDQEYATISDITADYAGKIYVARRGDILIFNAADGAQVGSISGSFPDTWYDSVVVDPANNLYAFHTSAGELDLIKMDAAGNQVFRKVQVTDGLVKKTEISTVRKLAVDGLGGLYLLDSSQNQVYKFDAQAGFLDRFGSKGDGPGMLKSPEDLAVDGQGRIYVLDWDGIEIFDNDGSFLKQIPSDYEGHAFDIQLDLQGNIYIITNAPQVYKYTVDFSQ